MNYDGKKKNQKNDGKNKYEAQHASKIINNNKLLLISLIENTWTSIVKLSIHNQRWYIILGIFNSFFFSEP